MSTLTETIVETRSGSRIAVHQGGGDETTVFAIGGLSSLSFADSGIRPVLDEAAQAGARVVMMDIAGSGRSTAAPGFTMDSWLADVEEIFDLHVHGPAVVTGASIGGWLMLLAHRRRPASFKAMCALAPAFDWDQLYIGPGIRDGSLTVANGAVVNADATMVAPRELLVSMSAHHLLRRPYSLGAPLHVIAGLRDEIAPAAPVREFIQSATGLPCTGEFLTAADHRISKLEGPVVERYKAWLDAQLPQARAATSA
jgi:pimeloyl-ACP methyl ester carboxylesterase